MMVRTVAGVVALPAALLLLWVSVTLTSTVAAREFIEHDPVDTVTGATCTVVTVNNGSTHAGNVLQITHGRDILELRGIEDEPFTRKSVTFTARGDTIGLRIVLGETNNSTLDTLNVDCDTPPDTTTPPPVTEPPPPVTTRPPTPPETNPPTTQPTFAG